MRCPRCSNTLVKGLYEGVTIDRCGSCQGIWLDQGEIQPILESQIVRFDDVTRERGRGGPQMGISEAEKQSIELCPKCAKPMQAMNFGANSGIIVDVCSGHGMWFDRNELEQIQAIHEYWLDARSDSHFQKRISGLMANEENQVAQLHRDGLIRALSAFPILGTLIAKITRS